MDTNNPSTMNNEGSNTMNTTTRKRHFPLSVILLLTLFVLLALSTKLSSRIGGELRKAVPLPVNQGAATGFKPDLSTEIRHYNDAVAAALERHLARLAGIENSFESRFREKGPERFNAARAAIPGIRSHFSSFGEMSGVVKDGAMDKAFGGDRLQDRFNAALDKPFIQPCARAGESLIADYETFAAEMDAESAAFREELAEAQGELPEAIRAEFPAETLQASMEQTYGALHWMPIKAGLVAAETAIEAATIRSTVAAARRLALGYGAKAIGKGAAAAAAPAADGPLPIFDIIAVGLAAWTVYDIYDLMDVLPREIEKNLVATTDSLQAQTIEAVSDAARQTFDAHAQAAKSLASAASLSR